MIELAEAVMNRLSSLYGQENVYNGYAEQDVSVPYVVFTFNPSGEAMDYAGAANSLSGSVTDYQLRVSCYCRSYNTAASRVNEVIEELTSNPTTLNMPTSKLLITSVLSREIIQEDATEQDNRIVFQGYVLLELKVNEGAT